MIISYSNLFSLVKKKGVWFRKSVPFEEQWVQTSLDPTKPNRIVIFSGCLPLVFPQNTIC